LFINSGAITDGNHALMNVMVFNVKFNRNRLFHLLQSLNAPDKLIFKYLKSFVSDYALTIKHLNGKLTDVLYNASVYKDDKGEVLGVLLRLEM
jgi:hypothetical protein